ncbi:MAG: PTS fructose transporter subunit IIA [Pseudomonadota bacterium]
MQMSVALLLITHDSIGSSLLESATNMLGFCPVATEVLSITRQFDPERDFYKAEKLCEYIDQGDGLLILTDMYGSTPSNIAMQLMQQHASRIVVSGINLSMLVRVMNYPQLSLAELAIKAESGAKDGVIVTDK